MGVIEIDRDPSPRTLRFFGLLFAVFCGLVGALLRWRFDLGTAATVVWIAGGGGAALYYLVPPLRRPLYLGWIHAAFPIGWLLSHLLLALVYYGVLTPIGLVMRLFRPDPLHRRFDPEAESYWVEYRASTDPTRRYFRQF